jgi:small neutral amino acid transporter SnatA (MarC family)
MELYQAQVVSTLRASLAVGAAPSLAAAGASLAAAFLDKGLDGGDAAVLQRLMGLLAAPLAQWGAAAQVRAGSRRWPCMLDLPCLQ